MSQRQELKSPDVMLAIARLAEEHQLPITGAMVASVTGHASSTARNSLAAARRKVQEENGTTEPSTTGNDPPSATKPKPKKPKKDPKPKDAQESPKKTPKKKGTKRKANELGCGEEDLEPSSFTEGNGVDPAGATNYGEAEQVNVKPEPQDSDFV